MKRNDGLQIARGVACLGVLVGHAANFAGILSKADPPRFVVGHLPSLGVFLFFVLSGFLMGSIALDGRTGAGRFAWKRFVRIYPAFWAAVVISILLKLAIGQPVPPPDFTYLALLPLNFEGGAYHIPAWTLIYEVTFYILVCGLIAVNASRRIALIGFVVWAVAILAFHIGGGTYNPVLPGRYIALSSMNLLFIAGALVAIIGTRPLERVPVPVFFGASAAAWWLGMQVDPGSVFSMVTYAASSSLALIGFSLLTVKSRLLVSIGNASYGIYLVHYFVLMALQVIAQRNELIVQFPIAFAGMTFCALAVAWGFGAIEHLLYQRLASRGPAPSAAAPLIPVPEGR